MFGKAISNLMIKPGLAPVFDSPENHGLSYEDVTFKAEDGVTLSGWLIKGGTDKVIVQSHFRVQCSRCGFTLEGKGAMERMLWNADIHFLNQAKYLVEAGYSVLMYDFRNHGDSGQGTSEWIKWGQDERKDVVAAVDFVASHPEFKDASIGLLSICMGVQEHIHHFVVNKAKNQLLNSNDTVGQIAYSLGFECPQHFSRVFKAKTGVSPGQFRKVG